MIKITWKGGLPDLQVHYISLLRIFRLLHKQRKPNTDLRNVVAQENQANQIREKKNYGKFCLLFNGFVVCLNIHITNVITGYSLKKIIARINLQMFTFFQVLK